MGGPGGAGAMPEDVQRVEKAIRWREWNLKNVVRLFQSCFEE